MNMRNLVPPFMGKETEARRSKVMICLKSLSRVGSGLEPTILLAACIVLSAVLVFVDSAELTIRLAPLSF